MRRQLLKGLAAFSVALVTTSAFAQSFPNKSIKLIVPFPPGGSTDVMARLIAKPLGEKLGQPVVIENRAGAGTVVGASYVAKSPADGYTLLLSGASTYSINPVLLKTLPYDPQTAFDNLAIVGTTGFVLLTNPSTGVTNLNEAIAAAKAKPGAFSYGSFGNGSSAHFVGELINTSTGMGLTHIPYKGSAPAITDLMGNQIPYTVETVVAVLQQLKSGRIKALAITSKERSTHLPQVPTFVESGHPSVVLSTWFGIVGPKGLPPGVRKTLENAIADIMKDPELRKQISDRGFEPEYLSPAEFSKRVASEIEVFSKIAKAANIQSQ